VAAHIVALHNAWFDAHHPEQFDASACAKSSEPLGSLDAPRTVRRLSVREKFRTPGLP
jgi:hypothetical protein